MVDHYRVDLPALSVINGNVYIRGATGLNCSVLSHVSVNGTFDCEGTAAPLGTSATGLSSAAKGGIGGGIAAGTLLIIVLAVWYFWQKRRSSSTFPEKERGAGKVAAAELPLGRHHEKSESAAPNKGLELTGDQEYRPRPLIESIPAA